MTTGEKIAALRRDHKLSQEALGEKLGLSRQAVKQKLLLLLRDEDPQHPLSDQQLCDLLSVDGMQIARRTIAKYRAELGVGPSSARRQ